MKCFICSIAVMMTLHGYSQKNSWTVQAGNTIEQTLGDSIIYRYPQFKPGLVYFKDGHITNAYLNLNFVHGEMQFIAPSKDTLSVADEATIKYIVIDRDTFYYSKVFIELVHSNSVAGIGRLEVLKQGNLEKEGGYGQKSSTTAINTTNTLYTNNQGYKLTENAFITLHKETVYFIGDRFDNFMPATKKNIYKMFNKQKATIDAFLDENKNTLNNEEKLVKLVDVIAEDKMN